MHQIAMPLLFVVALIFGEVFTASSQTPPAWGNPLHPSLNTGAYSLTGSSGPYGGTDADRTWMAQHFDIIYGDAGSDARIFNLMKSANPKLQLIYYIPFHSVLTNEENWMRNWASTNGRDPEGLYYHYRCDTVIHTRSTACTKSASDLTRCDCGSSGCSGPQFSVYKRILGFGGNAAACPAGTLVNTAVWLVDENNNGSYRAANTVRDGAQGPGTASSKDKARVPSTWWDGGYPNICPSCATFVDAFAAMAWDYVTPDNSDTSKSYDGIEGDTFNGSDDFQYETHLELTQEMANVGKTSLDGSHDQVEQDLISAHNTIRQRLAAWSGKPKFIFGPNAGDLNYIFDSPHYATLYANRFHEPEYNDFLMEYLLTTAFAYTPRIAHMKDLYNALQSGTRFVVNSQSNFPYGQYPKSYEHLVLATDLILNHQNAYFAWHVGDASNYSCQPNGSCQNSHWIKGYEFDLGTPAPNRTVDCWGQNGTDRMFLYAGDGTRSNPATACEQVGGGVSYTFLARRYTKGLALAYFNSIGGFSNFGTHRQTVPLDGAYRRLSFTDNTLGPPITSIDLGIGEGAILVSSTDTLPPAAPSNLTAH